MTAETRYGKVQGTETAAGYVYKGIPYAQPPVGADRFRPPQPPQPWDGVRVCDRFAPMAVQKEEKPDSFYGKEFFCDPGFKVESSEDCLYLNVWTPKDAHQLPVAVWYHGGGFQNGNGGEMEFDGEAFNRRGVILVTVNYRLGLLGYFCHEKLRDADGVSGNWGLRDQIAALDWVRENIGQFGGDPGCITIFGQSAGGMAVRDLVCCPAVKGKIARAILQSCNGCKGPLRADFGMNKMEKISARFLKRKRLSIEDLQTMDVDAILKLQWEYNFFAGLWTRSGISLTPVIDGKTIPANPELVCARGETARVPYLVGSLKNDMGVSKAGAADLSKSRMQMSLMRWAGCHTAQGVPGYAYHFQHELPGNDGAGAFHSAELWYIFGTLGRSWRPMGQADHALSGRMTDIWARFMKTGDPGWIPCTGETGYCEILKAE